MDLDRRISIAETKGARDERRAIVSYIHAYAAQSDDPGCCKRLANKLAQDIEREQHRNMEVVAPQADASEAVGA